MSVEIKSSPSVGLVVLALLSVYVIWGSTYLAIRFALEGGFTPFLLGGVRFTIAGMLMFAFLWLKGIARPTKTQWLNSAVMGFLLLVLGNGMVNLAEKTVSSGLAAVAVASVALWIGLFATLRGDRPSKVEWLGLAVGFLGVIWLNFGSSLTASKTGLIALIIAPLAWAYGSVWSRGRDLPNPLMTSAAQMLCAGVMMLIVGIVTGERMTMPIPKAIGAFWYLVFFGSIIGFSSYVWLLNHVRPALAGSYAYVNPAIAVLLGAVLAGERFTPNDLIAMAIILAAVVIITLNKKPKKVK